MNRRLLFWLPLCLLFGFASFAQQEKMTREDKDEKNDARNTRVKDKNDLSIFHRQMLALKEYTDERKKIPSIQKENKMPVKIVAVVDTSGDMDDEASKKTLIGYIRQDVGDNTTNIYEVTFDRAQKKIVSIKRTAEADDMDKEEKTGNKKTAAPKTVHKKAKGDEDDDGDEDDAPSKKKEKDDDKE